LKNPISALRTIERRVSDAIARDWYSSITSIIASV
jgi:hypothetical protein